MGATHFLASDFDFELPPELIAQHPAPERDQARLLLLNERGTAHHVFSDLPELLLQTVGAGALLVLNDTQVLPARLRARKLRAPGSEAALGGQVELLLCEPLPPGCGPDPEGTQEGPSAKPGVADLEVGVMRILNEDVLGDDMPHACERVAPSFPVVRCLCGTVDVDILGLVVLQ